MSLKSLLADHRIASLPPAEKRWALHHALARMNPTMDPMQRDLQIDVLIDGKPKLTSRPGVFRASYDDEEKGLRVLETTRVEHVKELAERIAGGQAKLLEAKGPAKFLRLLEVAQEPSQRHGGTPELLPYPAPSNVAPGRR